MTQDGGETRTWVFTFGMNHRHPTSDVPLGNRFVEVNGTERGARQKIMDVFGNKWSFQYKDRKSAGVESFQLTPIEI